MGLQVVHPGAASGRCIAKLVSSLSPYRLFQCLFVNLFVPLSLSILVLCKERKRNYSKSIFCVMYDDFTEHDLMVFQLIDY